MRILLTNDDGIESVGLHRLGKEIADRGHSLDVLAPSLDHSGAGASLGSLVSGTVGYTPHALGGLVAASSEVSAWAIESAPASCSIVGLSGALTPVPDVVVSGPNFGANTGRAVLHSGTIGAAVTAARRGVPALAVSLDCDFVEGADQDRFHFDTVARVGADCIAIVLEAWAAADGVAVTLNVNVPNRPWNELRGVAWADIATASLWTTTIAGVTADTITADYVRVDAEQEPNSDAALLAQGWVTLSLLGAHRLHNDRRIDLEPATKLAERDEDAP